ncbi:hypothetical protein AK812_SmicGene42908 [Symbiodinium microadriaticum]|uniref:HNH domain-containing protein n=1 Tax=Symbiodinium microadriaticum TaxID=2951 RepID=A0A1Q9C2C0_SYMMI|nr:hypothetical protein AK812_SmicGene42908 [Symbiodinium microadriaticum]
MAQRAIATMPTQRKPSIIELFVAEEEEAPETAVDRPVVAPGAVVDGPGPGAVVDGPRSSVGPVFLLECLLSAGMEQPKKEKPVKFVYYIDGHQVFIDELWWRRLSPERRAIFIEGVKAGLRATPCPPNDEEAWVELVLPALRLPASCPGMDSGKTKRSDPSVCRPLKETSSSEVDSDEFFDDQTPRPPKPMKKPGGEGQAGGEGEGSEGLGLEAVAAATWAADHVVPVHQAFYGQRQALQALCLECHRSKTFLESSHATSLESRFCRFVHETYACSPRLPPLVCGLAKCDPEASLARTCL